MRRSHKYSGVFSVKNSACSYLSPDVWMICTLNTVRCSFIGKTLRIYACAVVQINRNYDTPRVVKPRGAQDTVATCTHCLLINLWHLWEDVASGTPSPQSILVCHLTVSELNYSGTHSYQDSILKSSVNSHVLVIVASHDRNHASLPCDISNCS